MTITFAAYPARARVIYRATVIDGREAELHLTMDPEQATVADAWTRLRALDIDIDPRTLEIEVRRGAAPASSRSATPGLVMSS